MKKDPSSISRRKFVASAGATLVAGVAAAAGEAQVPALPSGPAGRPDPGLGSPEPLPLDRQLGFAVVGLGKLALGEIMDAFAAARRAKVTALVSGNRD